MENRTACTRYERAVAEAKAQTSHLFSKSMAEGFYSVSAYSQSTGITPVRGGRGQHDGAISLSQSGLGQPKGFWPLDLRTRREVMSIEPGQCTAVALGKLDDLDLIH